MIDCVWSWRSLSTLPFFVVFFFPPFFSFLLSSRREVDGRWPDSRALRYVAAREQLTAAAATGTRRAASPDDSQRERCLFGRLGWKRSSRPAVVALVRAGGCRTWSRRAPCRPRVLQGERNADEYIIVTNGLWIGYHRNLPDFLACPTHFMTILNT